MRVTALFALFVVLGLPCRAAARPPRDGFLNPAPPGTRLTLMPFVGPGFRATLEHQADVEPDMSDVRVQLMGTVAVPFAELAAHVDARFFLLSFGASAGYHHEWHLLEFRPDPATGRDRAGQPPSAEPPAAGLRPGTPALLPDQDPTTTFADLDRAARAMKDRTSDFRTAAWPFAEGRFVSYVPGYDFLGVSTLAARWEPRPDVSYDWENATVHSGGGHLRWEGYFLFRGRNLGFAGPALRALAVPRHRVVGNPTIGPFDVIVPRGSACQEDEGIPCRRTYEAELQYGVVAGLSPGWGPGPDAFLVRAFATWGLGNRLFGTQVFRQPLQILAAYQGSIEL